MLENIRKYNIILGSRSPRRRELLSQLRIPFKVVTIGGIEENYPDTLPMDEIPQFLANKKADAYLEAMHSDDLMITSDTLVILGDKVMGKPKDLEEAVSMLMELSGKVHHVVSGVCITTLEKRTSFSIKTEVKFGDITEHEARYYVDNYQPLDKAGAYGIQEWIGCVAVEWINGSFYNVMGLPVHQLYRELKNF